MYKIISVLGVLVLAALIVSAVYIVLEKEGKTSSTSAPTARGGNDCEAMLYDLEAMIQDEGMTTRHDIETRIDDLQYDLESAIDDLRYDY